MRIKFRTFELEFEGEDKFAKADLLELMDKVHSLAAILPDGSDDDEADDKGDGDKTDSKKTPQVKGAWSASKIAQKIGGKTGTELATAALAHLCIIKKQELATRKQILAEMKLATSFYRDGFGDNLTATLRSLVKSGKAHENGTNNYALSDDLITSIKAELAK